MKRLLVLLAAALFGVSGTLCSAQTAGQVTAGPGNTAGLLYASSFGQWSVPSGDNGPYSWSSPSLCRVSTPGGTLNPVFAVGAPIAIVDNNPAHIETVTPTAVSINNSNCSITVNPAYSHLSFAIKSGTGGLQEAINFASGLPYTVILTPDWSRLGGVTSMITAARGTANVGIIDQRTSCGITYLWSGSAYVAQASSCSQGTGVLSVSATSPLQVNGGTGPSAGAVAVSCPTCGSGSVTSVNGITPAVTIAAGNNITVGTNVGSGTVTISATSGSLSGSGIPSAACSLSTNNLVLYTDTASGNLYQCYAVSGVYQWNLISGGGSLDNCPADGTSTATAYTCTDIQNPTGTPSAVIFTPNVSSGVHPTLSVNGGTAYSLYSTNGSLITTNQIVGGVPYIVTSQTSKWVVGSQVGVTSIPQGGTGATSAAGAWANITGGNQTGSGTSTVNALAGSFRLPGTVYLGSCSINPTVGSQFQFCFSNNGGNGENIQNQSTGNFAVSNTGWFNTATTHGASYTNYFNCGITGINFNPSGTNYFAAANTGFCEAANIPMAEGTNDTHSYYWYWNSAIVGGFDSTGWKMSYPGLPSSSGQNCLQISATGYITNTGAACGSGGGSGTVGAGAVGQFAGYAAAGTAVTAFNPLHQNAKLIGAHIDGATDDTTIINNWLAAHPYSILDIPYDGNTAHCALISSPILIGTSGGGIEGSTPTAGGICSATPNIDMVQIYNTGGNTYPQKSSVRHLLITYTGPTASGFTGTATITGSAVTAFSVTTGGTNYQATPGIYVNGCWDVHTLATLSGGAITALTPATGQPALGTFSTGSSTGTCIPATQTWAANTVIPRYHVIVVNISGTNYLFSENAPVVTATTGSSAPSWNTTTVGVSTTTDNTATWLYQGVYGAVTVSGGSTGDPTGAASTGWCIDATGPTNGYNGSLASIEDVYCKSTGSGVRFNYSEVSRAANSYAAGQQDANGYGFALTGGSNQSSQNLSFTTSGVGWCGVIAGGQGFFNVGDCTNGKNQSGWYVSCGGCTVSGGDNEYVQGPNFVINGGVHLENFTDLRGGGMSIMPQVLVINGNLSIDLSTSSRAAEDVSIPFVKNSGTYTSITASGTAGAFANPASAGDFGAGQMADLNGIITPITAIPVRDAVHPLASANSNYVGSLYWLNPSTVGGSQQLVVNYLASGTPTTANLLPGNSNSGGVVSATYAATTSKSAAVAFTPPVAGRYQICANLSVDVAGTAGTFYIMVNWHADGTVTPYTQLGSTVTVTTAGNNNIGSSSGGVPNCVTTYSDGSQGVNYQLVASGVTGPPTMRYGVSVTYLGQ